MKNEQNKKIKEKESKIKTKTVNKSRRNEKNEEINE